MALRFLGLQAPRNAIDELFSACDRDGGGSIEPVELERYLKSSTKAATANAKDGSVRRAGEAAAPRRSSGVFADGAIAAALGAGTSFRRGAVVHGTAAIARTPGGECLAPPPGVLAHPAAPAAPLAIAWRARLERAVLSDCVSVYPILRWSPFVLTPRYPLPASSTCDRGGGRGGSRAIQGGAECSHRPSRRHGEGGAAVLGASAHEAQGGSTARQRPVATPPCAASAEADSSEGAACRDPVCGPGGERSSS